MYYTNISRSLFPRVPICSAIAQLNRLIRILLYSLSIVIQRSRDFQDTLNAANMKRALRLRATLKFSRPLRMFAIPRQPFVVRPRSIGRSRFRRNEPSNEVFTGTCCSSLLIKLGNNESGRRSGRVRSPSSRLASFSLSFSRVLSLPLCGLPLRALLPTSGGTPLFSVVGDCVVGCQGCVWKPRRTRWGRVPDKVTATNR